MDLDQSHREFAGIENFRDFGGTRVRAGMLFRSGHLANATEGDISRLEALGIRTIIDLRRPSEQRQRPSRAISGVRTVTSDDGDRAEAPHLEFLRQGNTSDAAVEEFLLDYYRKLPFEPQYRDLFGRALEALDQGPILIHCTAGKDRTGILAALILVHLGAGWDEIVRDFLLTNSRMLREPHLTKARDLSRSLLGRDPTPAVMHAMLGVQERHLAATFEAICGRSGDVRRYLASLVGR